MTTPEPFYIVKRPAGTCDIIPGPQIETQENHSILETWGPFDSENDAIARRVGLIRAGKCRPQ